VAKKKADSKQVIEAKVNHDYFSKAIGRLEAAVAELTERVNELERRPNIIKLYEPEVTERKWWQWWT
jgi:hypothetical protein